MAASEAKNHQDREFMQAHYALAEEKLPREDPSQHQLVGHAWRDDRFLHQRRCELWERNRGRPRQVPVILAPFYALSVWHPGDEQLHASLCEVYSAMVWVTRPSYENRWRVGGTALEQDCLEEEWSLELRA